MFSDLITAIEKVSKTDNNKEFFLRVKPVVDIYETNEAVIIRAEMPNVAKDDLHVQVNNRILHIQGKKQSIPEQGEFIWRETSDVIYERFFELQDNLDQEHIKASYEAGILKITLPKREEAQPKKIEIK